MEIGIAGLGRMGANMARRLMAGGHTVVTGNRSHGPIEQLEKEGAVPAWTWEELSEKLSAPRVIWVMVPAGSPTEDLVDTLAGLLDPGDVIVDGGNSFYQDSVRRAEKLAGRGIEFCDAGTSGGVWGLEKGYSLMIGGEPAAVGLIRPALETLAPAPDLGWGHVGPAGSGHFVKMVHNGIEYGMMEAYAEGFEILKSKKEFDLDVHQVAEVWRFGSVVQSWLLDLTAEAFAEDADLQDIRGWVADSGEGRWTVKEAIDLEVSAPVISLSLFMRYVSRQDASYAAKVLAAMRNKFGGHSVKRPEEPGD